jgi:UDP-N-acetylglucosamine--N-acetylmuramyl-(pentapeptide) pyrophosphoryl-undecaprenol N-acetylglucosamine transferase
MQSSSRSRTGPSFGVSDLEQAVGPVPRDRSGRQGSICLAASGGGHVRQLLDLQPVWGGRDHFFVSEDTALARTIAEAHPTDYVAHVALGQARLGAPFRMVAAAVRNFLQSARIVLARRPAVVLTTGAGAVFFVVLWARLLGAKVILIESFARFDRPSMFFRLTRPLAHHQVVQSPALARFAPDAAVFDPLRILEGPRPAKEPLLFATVGATLPFDRLVSLVADAKAAGLIPERVLIQTGIGGARPEGVEVVETLGFDAVNRTLETADIVVCHGGTGSLITALRQGCRVIAVPRLHELGEHYDDHQAEITGAFAERGLIEVANTPEEFAAALVKVRAQAQTVSATTDPQGLIAHLHALLGGAPEQQQAA